MSKPAAIYCRISDDPEGLEYGITRQEEDCRAYAKQGGYDVKYVYPENDRGASTRSKKSRPLYTEMLEAIRAGEIGVVIAYSNSRLTRRPTEYEELIRLHEQTGVRYLTVVSGEDNLATADGRMVARIKASIDAAEAERIAERVSRAALQRAEKGEGNGGRRPFGWQADDRTKLDPAEHEVIKELGRRLLAGDSLHGIVRDLNEREVPTVTGVPWTVPTVRSMMVNPRLAGVRVYKGRTVGTGDWQPAIDMVTHRQLVRLLENDARRTSPGNVRKNLLPGIARCVEGHPFSVKDQRRKGRPNTPRYWDKACGIYRTLAPVDRYVEDVIIEMLHSYQPAPMPNVDPDAERKVEELRERIAKTVEHFATSDAMTEAQLEATLRVLNRRLREAELKAVPAAAPAVLRGLTGPAPDEAWGELPLARKRAVIDALVTVRLHRSPRGSRKFSVDTVQIERR